VYTLESDIGKALAYQVKREIAERYFGLRKLIEEDKHALSSMLAELDQIYQQKIGRDMVRIYCILKRPELIDEFLSLTGWKGRPFFDEYMVDSPTIRKRMFEDMDLHGWFNQSRLNHLLIDSYERLFKNAKEYRKRRFDAIDEALLINEEIKQFENKFSLDEIMSFIKMLGSGDQLTGVLGDSLPTHRAGGKAGEFKIEPVEDLDATLPAVPDLPRPEKIRSKLKNLAGKVVESHREDVFKAVRKEDERD